MNAGQGSKDESSAAASPESRSSSIDRPPMVAVDLGAGSCRVSLLTWSNGHPDVSVIHRFPNAPLEGNGSLHWDLDNICAGVEQGLRLCAEQSKEPIASIGVDGWAVDYVRLNAEGQPIGQPFCYRDERNEAGEAAVHGIIDPARLYELTGLQRQRFNTIYQLYADKIAGVPDSLPWVNLPEYVQYRLGGRPVSEYTNATHTGMIDLKTRTWSAEIFADLGYDLAAAPELVQPGTDVGPMQGPLAELPAFQKTRLIAPACHDTASAIAAIAHDGEDWAYLSSGTWSLVGTVQSEPLTTVAAFKDDFTNLGAAGGGICFHKGVNGMWLIQQCLEDWAKQGHEQNIAELIHAAEKLEEPDGLLDVDHPDLVPPGDMTRRINSRRLERGLPTIPEGAQGAPFFANLIFHSLAHRYAQLLHDLTQITGKTFRKLYVVGGGGRNAFLNRLTARTTGLEIRVGHVESSTIGNFAIQMASLEAGGKSPSLAAIGHCARELESAKYE